MNKTILNVSNSFMNEALSSPSMLEDLAAMEKYMSESYDGRTFVELLQNADDAGAKRVKVFLINNTIVVANDGRPFDKNDILSICRSGASSKQRGNNIGYRGVGFKSATAISTEIVIHSTSAYFTFSKSICARTLGKSEQQVPTVRIPFPFSRTELNSEVNSAIDVCKNDGYTTFFIFMHANVSKFIKELDGFDAGWILFLKNVSEVDIDLDLLKKKCFLKRKILSDTEVLLSVNGSNNQWYIITEKNVSIAFKYDVVEGILPCGTDEAVFHCFLPTLDKTGFPFKVNADFSTDPSRKHIITDDITNRAIKSIQNLYVNTICRITGKADVLFYPILSLLNMHTTLNSLVTQFESGLLDKLRVTDWVPLNNGQHALPGNTKLFPKWMDSSERNIIHTKIPFMAYSTPKFTFIERVDNVQILLAKLGATELTVRELSEILTNIDYIQLISPQLIGKLFVYCYRTMSLDGKMIRRMFVPLAKGYMTLADTSIDTELNTDFVSAIKSMLNVKEIESLSINYAVFSVLQKKKVKTLTSLKKHDNNDVDTMARSSQFAVNKWKTPTQNCMAIETLNGNTVKVVERNCDEYNIISTDPDGNVTYISVKTVGVLGDSFKLTESEYSAAQRLGNSYKVYLFTTETSNIKYMNIVNPIDSLQLKKVVKEWEWLCESYDSNDFSHRDNSDFKMSNTDIYETVNFDQMDGDCFERFCAQLLIKNGYEDVCLTKCSGDQGVDIIAYKDNIKYGIQCKCYSSDVGNSSVQEVFAGKTFYKCNIGIVLTNRSFTPAAIQLAQNNGVVLWDRSVLNKLIKNSK